MLPAVVDYLLGMRQYANAPGVYTRTYQAIVPNFPPLQSISYSVSPTPNTYGYILYEWVFGEAMVPHAFDVKFDQGGNKIFDAIISGYFTTHPIQTFVFVTESHPLNMMVTNLRLLVNYYELTTFYLTVPNENIYNLIIDALRRMHTSTRSEELAEQANNLLTIISEKPSPVVPYPPIAGGRR